MSALYPIRGIPDIVIRRTLDGLPARPRRAMGRLPSPWVSRGQVKAFIELVDDNAARLEGRRHR